MPSIYMELPLTEEKVDEVSASGHLSYDQDGDARRQRVSAGNILI